MSRKVIFPNNMRWILRTTQIFLCGLIILGATFTHASVTLKVSASNPSTFKAREFPFKSYLPKGIQPEDVINSDGLEVIYDEEKDHSYVYKDIVLEPQASVIYEIEIEDIWLIDEEEMEALNSVIEGLVEELIGSKYEEVALEIQKNTREKIEQVLSRQDGALIYKVGPTEHMAAFDANSEVIAVIQGNINDLQRLVTSSKGGQDASNLEQQAKAVKLLNAKRIKDQVLNYGAADVKDSCLIEESLKIERENIVLDPRDFLVMRINVENPSKTKARTSPLRFFLAREVQASDVVDSDNLSVGFDFEKSLYYVYDDKVALEPGEIKEYAVSLNNKWAINKKKLYGLKVYLESLSKVAADEPESEASQEITRQTLNDVYALLKQTDPVELTEDHVTAFRNDLTKVDTIRQSVQQVEDFLVSRDLSPEMIVMEKELLCREAKLKQEDTKDIFGLSSLLEARRIKFLAGTIFRGKSLATASTLMIIYYIIIFLGIISGVFYYVNIREQKSIMFDPLTGAFARGYALERFREELRIAKGAGNKCSLLVMDIDKFKGVNDTYGHTVGDTILKEFVIAMRKGIRATDLLGRFGGDEFMIILPTGEKAIGLKIAQSIARIVEGTAIKVSPQLTLSITTSVGVATFPQDSGTAEDLFDKADQALYEVKKRGGNGAEAFGEIL